MLRREAYEGLELNAKVELIRSLIPLGLMHVQALLEDEVESLAGRRYARTEGASGTHHGSNPRTVVLDGQRVPIRVPRVRSEQAEIPLRSYPALHGTGEADEALLRRVLYGISCRNYESVARAIPGAIGLSSSSVSRSFVAGSVYSEAQFKTLKYRPDFRDRFGSLEHGRSFCADFFAWYNLEHHHVGLGLFTNTMWAMGSPRRNAHSGRACSPRRSQNTRSASQTGGPRPGHCRPRSGSIRRRRSAPARNPKTPAPRSRTRSRSGGAVSLGSRSRARAA